MINLDILLDVSEIGGKGVNQDRKIHIVDQETGKALLLVADGVGGSKQGEIAAQIIVDTATMLWDKKEQFNSAKAFLDELSKSCNDKVKQQIEKSIKTASTLCAVAIWPEECVSVHAGDSRIYLFNDSGVVKHSRDHSLAYSKFLMGEISEEDLATHPTQTQLLSCVDGGDPSFEFTEWEFNSGDVFVVCTDGFWEIYSNQSLHELILNPDRSMLFVNHFDRILEERPKHDNTTATIAQVNVQQRPKSSKKAKASGAPESPELANNKDADDNDNTKTYLLIALVVIVALSLIFLLPSNEQVSKVEPEVSNMPSKQNSKSKPDNTKKSDNENTDNNNESDLDNSDSDDNSPSQEPDQSAPEDSNEDESQDNSEGLPDINEGLDPSEGLEIEIDTSKDIESQVKNSLVQKKIISKESDVVLGDAKKDKYATIRDLRIKVRGIPIFGAQAKLIKTEKGFEVVTGKLANIKAPDKPPERNFSHCLNEHADLTLADNADPQGKLYLDAKTSGYLWMSIAVENATRAEFRVIFHDNDCTIKLKEPLMISKGGNS